MTNQIIQKKRNQRRNIRLANPSARDQEYDGPFRLYKAIQQESLTEIELVQVLACTSSGAGVINNVVSLALNAFNENGNITNLWDEVRLLSATSEFVPNTSGWLPASTAGAPFVSVLDRDSNVALTTLSGGFQYESSQVTPINQINRNTYRMSGSEDAAFSPVSSFAFGNFKYYSAALTASTTYGYIFIRSIFQVRGRL
jgi:hypothetical protein